MLVLPATASDKTDATDDAHRSHEYDYAPMAARMPISRDLRVAEYAATPVNAIQDKHGREQTKGFNVIVAGPCRHGLNRTE